MGSLTYTLKNLSDCTATIDVNVPKLRGLTQIRLVPAEAIGENGSFKGTPYYTVGDVVIDGDDECWICARGAYSPAKKEDTHWFSFTLTTDNVISVKRKEEVPGNLPINLGSNTEKMRYLIQFLKFVVDPNAYKDKNGQLDSICYPKGVGNLGREYLSWEQMNKIAKAWREKNLTRRCFDEIDFAYQNQTFDTFFNPQNKNYIYYRGSSKSIFSSYYRIYCKCYTGKECKEESADFLWTASDINNFDIWDYANNGEATEAGHEKALVVRYKTGKELNGKKSVKATEAISTVEEIYRYNANK